VSDTVHVQLLEQRLRTVEELNVTQSRQIEKLQHDAAAREGAQRQAEHSSASMARFIGPVMSITLFILSLGVGGAIYGNIDKMENDIIGLALAAEKREARVTAMESVDNAQTEKISSTASSLSAMRAEISGFMSQSSTAAIEVETQLRSLNEVLNTRSASDRQLTAVLWKKVLGEELPSNDFLSDKIPAQATTIIGSGSIK
jgi:ABC-type transporter Mla subunit MlaD